MYQTLWLSPPPLPLLLLRWLWLIPGHFCKVQELMLCWCWTYLSILFQCEAVRLTLQNKVEGQSYPVMMLAASWSAQLLMMMAAKSSSLLFHLWRNLLVHPQYLWHCRPPPRPRPGCRRRWPGCLSGRSSCQCCYLTHTQPGRPLQRQHCCHRCSVRRSCRYTRMVSTSIHHNVSTWVMRWERWRSCPPCPCSPWPGGSGGPTCWPAPPSHPSRRWRSCPGPGFWHPDQCEARIESIDQSEDRSESFDQWEASLTSAGSWQSPLTWGPHKSHFLPTKSVIKLKYFIAQQNFKIQIVAFCLFNKRKFLVAQTLVRPDLENLS